MLFLFNFPDHFLDPKICGGADRGVFQHYGIDLVHLFAVGVRIFAAGFRADFINRAGIIRQQEMAREILQNLVIILVHAQKFRLKIGRFHSQMPGNTLNIFFDKKWPGRFAAVGALQAVNFSKNFLVRFLGDIVEVFGRLFPQPVEEFFVLLLSLERNFFI